MKSFKITLKGFINKHENTGLCMLMKIALRKQKELKLVFSCIANWCVLPMREISSGEWGVPDESRVVQWHA
jgi:hypothetical protein